MLSYLGGRGTPPPARAGFPFPPSPPSPPLRAFIREDKIRRDTQSPSSPTCPPAVQADDHARMPGRSRKPTAEKKGRKLPAKKVCARRAPAGEDTPPTGGSLSIQGKCSPPVRRRTKEKPAASASRGAEAIPATRERRSRRAYHPRSGKMRADWPPAASGGQGTRHATVTPSTTRTRGVRGS